MTRNKLDKHLDVIKQFHKRRREAEKGIEKICSDYSVSIDIADHLEDAYVMAISQLANDNDGWIRWYIYDNDFGRKRLQAMLHDKMIPINNTRQLLTLIEQSNLGEGNNE
jgi:hypothetical protein